jgi:SAM-dependent methyltransferase
VTWRDRYFEEGYLKRWRLAPADEQVAANTRALLELTGASAGSRILDIGCGHGRHAVPLAQFGFIVVGLDASWALLQRARSQSRSTGGAPAWVRGDMRLLPFQNAFDAVWIIDAFGYLDADDEEQPFLRGIRAVLKGSGRLLIRNPNGAFIRGNFRPVEESSTDTRSVSITNRLDDDGRWLSQDVSITDSEGAATYHRRQRIYAPGELQAALESVGFRDIVHYGDLSGAPFSEAGSTRMITMCRTD